MGLDAQRIDRNAALLESFEQPQHAVAMRRAPRLPRHVIVVDELGLRRRLACGVEGKVEHRQGTAHRPGKGRLPQLPGLVVDRLVDDIIGMDAGAVAAADRADMLGDHPLRLGARIRPEIISGHPRREPVGMVPDQGMAADREMVLLGKGEETVGRREVEALRRRAGSSPI